MEHACAAEKANADLLEWPKPAYAEAVFERDAALGETEVGQPNRVASLNAAKTSVVTQRDVCFHLQRGLASTRVVSEDGRRMLVQENERDGGGTLLPKRPPPAPKEPARWDCRWCRPRRLFVRPQTRRPILRRLSPVLHRRFFHPGS